MLYLAIFIFLFIIIILIYSVKLKVTFKYSTDGTVAAKGSSVFFLLGGMEYKFPESRGKSKIKLFDTKGAVKYIHGCDNIYMRRIKNYFFKKLVCKNLMLKVSIGAEDACVTAVLCGVLQSVLGILDSYISSNLNIIDKKIFIEPNFAKPQLKIDFDCIFEIGIVHIITVLVKNAVYFFGSYNYIIKNSKKTGFCN